MVLKPEPVFAAVEAVKEDRPDAKVVIMTPSGISYTQKVAHELAECQSLIFLCGHYEGYDERILSLADYQLSIGDYVLTGGELPAMVVVDSVVRLLPGVLGSDEQYRRRNLSNGLLEYPHYTRPEEFRGMKVPEVLQNGHHAEIVKWRREQSLAKTKQKIDPTLFRTGCVAINCAIAP